LAFYRVYFRSHAGTILGRDDFEAEDDRAAQAIAESLGDACSDISQSFDLWQGARRVVTVHNAAPGHQAGVSGLNDQVLLRVIERQKIIQRSGWAIARSTRLLERVDQGAAKDISSGFTGGGTRLRTATSR
jgi:hypothetical protein